MTSNYTHELWYRSAIDETDQEWTRAEIHPLRARVEIDGQRVNFILEAKVMFHDEAEYQFRPIAPG